MMAKNAPSDPAVDLGVLGNIVDQAPERDTGMKLVLEKLLNQPADLLQFLNLA